MSKSIIIPDDDLRDLLGKFRTNANHYISTCPYCGKEKHFYINKRTQLWDCKKCGEEGNIIKLLHHLGKLFLLGEFKSIDRNKIKLLSEFEEQEPIESLEVEKRKLPIGFKRIYEDDYLNTRKLTKENYKKFRIGRTSLKPSLKDYVIFSIDEDGESKGYVARYTKKIRNKKQLRYKNDKGAKFSHLLFGYDEITEKTDTVILVEGLIDKITLDNILQLDNQDEIKSLATFGKKISDFQVLKLLKKNIKNVILIFDYDAITEMKKYGIILENFFNVKIGFTFGKDINDSDESEVIEIFYNLKTPSEFNRKTVKMLK